MTTVYQHPAGIWHIVVNGHELRQHCFTRETALVRAAMFSSRVGIDAYTQHNIG